MDFSPVSDREDIVQDVIYITGLQGNFAKEPFTGFFVFYGQRNRKVELKLAAVEKHEKLIGCSVLRTQGSDKDVGVNDNLERVH